MSVHGYTAGALPDKLLAFFQANGTVSPQNINDAEKDFLLTQTGELDGAIPDLWDIFLTANGYTSGGVHDKQYAWWAAGASVGTSGELELETSGVLQLEDTGNLTLE